MTSHAAAGLQDRFALAQKMATEAGAAALAHFNARERLVIETKADPHDVVSIADREVEDLIRARIAAAFPGDAMALLQSIISESPLLSPILHDWEKIALPDCWLVAGAIADGLEPFLWPSRDTWHRRHRNRLLRCCGSFGERRSGTHVSNSSRVSALACLDRRQERSQGASLVRGQVCSLHRAVHLGGRRNYNVPNMCDGCRATASS